MIPTVILSRSDAEVDVVKSYQLQANCYLTKPVELDVFETLVRASVDFWLTKARLPQRGKADVSKSIKVLLLVEDNPGDARLLREMFNEQGLQKLNCHTWGS